MDPVQQEVERLQVKLWLKPYNITRENTGIETPEDAGMFWGESGKRTIVKIMNGSLNRGLGEQSTPIPYLAFQSPWAFPLTSVPYLYMHISYMSPFPYL